MSKSTFKILFYVRKNQVNKEGKAGVMVRITVYENKRIESKIQTKS